ncbi:hypothetical protein Rfer_4346 (plasmid) [Rhodoferax ferrireducens T118]|uniref:Uncharacterized protein n=1 Tax=Albidiferax ferrireducens (strain ATCC BAA-621 / DSM 15236 / T118) TaxID=338969 RepID=Q21QB3_ALBFT|nr:hypothetical protein Rfer_4346 [Rhodoferax ferrireducens T118]
MNTLSIPAQRGAHCGATRTDLISNLQSPRNAGRTNAGSPGRLDTSFNPRATRGARDFRTSSRQVFTSIPAQRGAHHNRITVTGAYYLQSPRNAGRTTTCTGLGPSPTFNPRATRGALGHLTCASVPYPSIPAQRGAHLSCMPQ